MNKEWRTEYLLTDNTFQGVCRAMELAGQGKDVILAVEETYPAADICGQCPYRRSAPLLPERKGSCMCAQLLPDHGVMPEVVYGLNLLSHGKSFSIKPYVLVTDRLAEGERDYEAIEKGIYNYMESIAYAGEHSKRKEFIPLLCRLTKLPEFEEAFAYENRIALMSQRWQMLWVILNRTLFLLGSGEGQKGLERARESSSAAIRIGAEKVLARQIRIADERTTIKLWKMIRNYI